MKKSLTILIISILILSALSLVFAHDDGNCEEIVIPKESSEFFDEIPNINSNLGDCQFEVPKNMNFLIRNGNVLVTINLNSGQTENFFLTFEKGNLTSIMRSLTDDYNYELVSSEDAIEKTLNSENFETEILSAYNNEEIEIKPKGLLNKFKWFFGKLFIVNTSS